MTFRQGTFPSLVRQFSKPQKIAMLIQQFEDKFLSHFAYAIVHNGEMVLIDPSRNPQPYYDFAKQNNAKIIAVIETQTISTPLLGTTIPIRQIAKLTNDWSEGQIIRRNGIKTVTVKADVSRNALPYKVLNAIRPQIESIDNKNNVTITYGGELENEYENYVPLSKSLATSFVLIFLIILFQFKSFRLVFLIMLTIPLSIFGAAIGLVIMRYPFGLTVFLGLMTLMGIVVRNGIILIEYAEELRRSHQMNAREASIASAKRRMRPIFLTSAAGAVGVVPMMVSGSSLWGPLATVIFFGLLFSMLLSLYVLPVMYHLLSKKTGRPVIKK